MADPGQDADTSSIRAASARSELRTALEVFSQVVAPASLITAALYYFGYIRQQTFYGYFGVDVGTVGISTTGYLVGSARVAFRPLSAILVVALAMLALHYVIALRLMGAKGRRARVIASVMACCGILLLILAMIGLRRITAFGSPLVPPLALGCGTLLIGYAAYIAELHFDLSATVSETLAKTKVLRIVILSGILLVALFWAVANYAFQRGVLAAEAFDLSLPVQHQAIVYTKERLQIMGPGVTLAKLDEQNAKYSYRYSGLRVLAHSNGHWLLLPAGWSRTNGSTVIILPDEKDDVRVDLAP